MSDGSWRASECETSTPVRFGADDAGDEMYENEVLYGEDEYDYDDDDDDYEEKARQQITIAKSGWSKRERAKHSLLHPNANAWPAFRVSNFP